VRCYLCSDGAIVIDKRASRRDTGFVGQDGFVDLEAVGRELSAVKSYVLSLSSPRRFRTDLLHLEQQIRPSSLSFPL
jgi:hypothetical protein